MPTTDFQELNTRTPGEKFNIIEKEINKVSGSSIFHDSLLGSNQKTESRNALAVDLGNINSTLFPPTKSGNQEYFVLLQQWEGVVLERNETAFTARIVDVTNGGPDGDIEVELEEISQDDKSLVIPGNPFQWYIGYKSVHGTQMKLSYFYFKRLPKITKSEIERSEREAEAMYKLFNKQ